MLKNFTYSIVIFLLFGLLSCSSAKVAKDQTELDRLINGKNFEAIFDWAQPQVTNAMMQLGNSGLFPPGSNVGMISLQGNANYLKVLDTVAKAELPFFGERQMGGAYNSSNTGIVFDAIPKDYTIEQRKKGGYIIQFSINDKHNTTENYRITLELYPNLSSSLLVYSSQRFNIRYRGSIRAINTANES